MNNRVITFGCRLNNYESEAIKSALQESGEQNLIVFNSCSVTSEAERQLRQSIRKTAKENPDAKIIVTGCAAQINPRKYAAMKEVNLVLGNNDKSKAESYVLKNLNEKNIVYNSQESTKNQASSNIQNPEQINQAILRNWHQDQIFIKENTQNYPILSVNEEEKILVNDIMSVRETASYLVSGFENKNRAFVQVQNGCNHRCTFCIIPYGRGNSRSVPLGEIVRQVKILVENGYREVVLTGVDITDYGRDLLEGLTFSGMVKRLLKLVPELPRLRISSVDVAEIDNDFLDLIANQERLMPYLHISLQAGDDTILKRMKRRHNRAQVIDFCNQVRSLRDNVTFGSDIIAGFPTETDAMFKNTRDLISETGIIFNHIFPYSIRQGTPAAKMPQVEKRTIKERAAILRETSRVELQKFLFTQKGRRTRAIIESDNIARCENFTSAVINNFDLTTSEQKNSASTNQILSAKNGALIQPGNIVDLLITGHNEDLLTAELLG